MNNLTTCSAAESQGIPSLLSFKSDSEVADIFPMEPAAGEDNRFASRTFLARLRANALDPTVLALPIVAATLCLFRLLHLIALEPYWLYIAVLIGSGTIRLLYSSLWSESDHRWYRSGYIGIYMLVIAIVAYTTGWGPILSIGFLFGAAAAFELFGSKATVPCLVWTTVAMAVGQVAIGLHLAPTIIREPIVQGVAALGLLGALLVIQLLGAAAAGREALEADLRRSEQRFSALVTSSSDIVIIAGADGKLQYASPAFESVLGYSSTAVVNILGETLIHPDDRAGLHAAMAAAGVHGSAIHKEVRLRRTDGDWLWFEAAITNLTADPNVNGFVADLRDITRRKNAEDQLAHAALHDALTGLPNRTLILNRTEQMLARARRQHTATWRRSSSTSTTSRTSMTPWATRRATSCSPVAATTRRRAPRRDTVGRLGGDEFVVLVEGASLAAGSRWWPSESATSWLPRFHRSKRYPAGVTASIGIAEGDRAQPGELLRDADIALYQAKARVSMRSGRSALDAKAIDDHRASKSTCTVPWTNGSSS